MACVLSLAAMGQALVAPYTLEVLDQPYETLTDATVLESEVWDTPEGWDDPEFVVPVGFEFDMLETTISMLFQDDVGSSFVRKYGPHGPNEILIGGSLPKKI